MATFKCVEAAAKALGATATQERYGNEYRLGVEAPQGSIWAEGIHEFVDWTYAPWKPDYSDMLSRMSYGIEPCTDPECDWCHPLED